MNINDITITSLETITAFDIATGSYLFTLDELQNATIAQSQEKTDITGKQGRKLATLKRNKAVTISGTNGIVSHGLLELQTGANFENKATDVMWTDYITVPSNVADAATTYKAIGTAGAEIIALYKKNADGTLGAKLIQDASASSGKFAYNPSTKKLSFHTDVVAGDEFVAYYKRKITADTMADTSDKYSGKCVLYIDALAEDKCSNVYRLQIHVPKADFDGEFSLEMGDNQTVHEFKADALSGACGAGSVFFNYTLFGVNADDDSPAKSLSGIAITTAPTKTTYNANESFAPAGMVVTASYSDGSDAVLNAGSYTYSPNGALTVSNTVITVSYTEGGVTKTATQAITVS